MPKLIMACAAAALIASSPQSVAQSPACPATASLPAVQQPAAQVGLASWYGEERHGNLTASGEVFDMNQLTAAHREIPFHSKVRVTNLRNQRSVVLKVNDRGPGIRGRIIDVSMAAAKRLGFLGAGLTRVRVELVNPRQ